MGKCHRLHNCSSLSLRLQFVALNKACALSNGTTTTDLLASFVASNGYKYLVGVQ